ncbi:MAG: response regulator [Rhodospirillales bacterium]|nr:response regulator [Rhodospirillales bacterium]
MSLLFLSLRVRLLLVVLAALLPQAVNLALSARTMREHSLEEARTMARNNLIANVTVYEAFFDRIGTTLRILAKSPALQTMDDRCDEHLASVYREINNEKAILTNIYFVSAESGIAACSATAAGKGLDLSDRQDFQKALQTRKLTISEKLEIGRASKRAILPLGYPVFAKASSAPVGVLMAAIDAAHFPSLSLLDNPEEAALMLFDSVGTIISRLPDHDRWVGRNVSDSGIFQHIRGAESDEGIVETTGVDGIARYYGFKRHNLGGSSLYFAIGWPDEVLTADADRHLGRDIAVTVISTLLSLTLAWIFVKHLVMTPVDSLLERIGKFAGKVNGDEFARLDHSVGSLTEEAKVLRNESRETERDLEAIIDASPTAIIVLDAARKVMRWSRAAEILFARSAKEAIGRRLDFWPGDDGDAVETLDGLLSRVFGGANLTGSELTCKSDDNRSMILSISVAPLWFGGDVKGVVLIAEDVTERRAIDERLHQAQKMEAIGQLTGGIAHDFNNILGVIVGNLDLLEQYLKDLPAAADLANAAIESALRGAELTKSLLAFSRRQPLKPRIVELGALINGFSTLLRRTLGEQVELEVQTAPDLWPVIVDPTQMESTLLNLAINARDAMPGGGRLRIGATNKELDDDYVAANPEAALGRYVCVEVTDTGTGIPASVLPRVFEPYFTTKPTGKGSGLGLAMVHGFIKQSGGHIKIYSEAGYGTTLRIYLPMALSKDAAESEPAKVWAAKKGKGESILAVEDDPNALNTVVSQLTSLGYRVQAATNGKDALAILKRERVDLVFSDVVMPGGISGIDLAKACHQLYPDLPVLLTSGFPGSVLNELASDPAITLLNKPYRLAELAAKLRELFERTSRLEDKP